MAFIIRVSFIFDTLLNSSSIKYNSAPKPFDRHDWYISRCGQARRYVIDYYEAPEEVPGVPVFHLDVRPALDDAESVMVRFKEAAQVKWNQWFPSAQPSASTDKSS